MEKGVIVTQIRAALKMLRAAIEACPDSLWNREADHNRFWVLAYHALFFAHLYLFPSEETFEPWEEQIEGCPHMGRQHLGDWSKLQAGDRYTKSDVLAYCAYVDGLASDRVESTPFDAPVAFPWLQQPCTQAVAVTDTSGRVLRCMPGDARAEAVSLAVLGVPEAATLSEVDLFGHGSRQLWVATRPVGNGGGQPR